MPKMRKVDLPPLEDSCDRAAIERIERNLARTIKYFVQVTEEAGGGGDPLADYMDELALVAEQTAVFVEAPEGLLWVADYARWCATHIHEDRALNRRLELEAILSGVEPKKPEYAEWRSKYPHPVLLKLRERLAK